MAKFYKVNEDGSIATLVTDIDEAGALAAGYSATKSEDFMTKEEELKAVEAALVDPLEDIKRRLTALEGGS